MKKIISLLFMVLSVSLFSQSITKTANGFSLEMSDEEKAVKSSSTMIKSKETVSWTTSIGSLLKWKSEYNKEAKMYTLYKSGIKYYESTTITGIRSKYASDLLGREIQIQ